MTPPQTPLTVLETALAGVLRAERARLGLSLDEIHERSGGAISRVAFNRLEKAERHADMNQLEASARALGMSLTRLLTLAEQQVVIAGERVPVITTPRVTVSTPERLAAGALHTTAESNGPDRP